MNDDRVFLHCCCGPCALYPLQVLRREGFEVTGYFDNPNIHPYKEFQARLGSYRLMAETNGLRTRVEDRYGLELFMRLLKETDEGVYRAKSDERCALCYKLRLDKTAAACREAGLKTFSTTLLVSPYQRHDLIRETGGDIAAAYGLTFLYRDFRPGFRQGQAMAREAGLYMQGYCGCVFSEYERYGERS